MKSLNQMTELELTNLLKIYRVLTYNLMTYNSKEKEKNFGFEISVKRLFNETVYNTLVAISRVKKENYEDFGFKFIEYITQLSKYQEKTFIKDLEQKVKFIENLQKELNQLSKFNQYELEFKKSIVKLNKISDRQFTWSLLDNGEALFVEFYTKNRTIKEVVTDDKGNYHYISKNEQLFNQETYKNFLLKYPSLMEELEFTEIFEDSELKGRKK